jgi:hypothetical protein
MKVIRIKKIGKVPVGRIVELTESQATREINQKISEPYNGDFLDGQNPVEHKKAEETKAKELLKIKAKKETKTPPEDSDGSDGELN